MPPRKKLFVAIVAVACALALVSVVDARGYRRYFKLRQEVTSLRAEGQRLSGENRAMMAEIERLRSDPEAIERAAREELGFVKPGEIVLHLE